MATRIAIASGKGGTGKTTVAANLAHLLARQGKAVCYADCDVEEPNGHLFLRPTITRSIPALTPVPVVDEARCTGCGLCAKICRFGAIARLGSTAMVFPELCHGCGGCTLVCPARAITEQPRETGVVETGDTAGGVRFVHGRLTVGEALSPPVIAAVKAALPMDGIVFLDAPPGTSCPVVATVRDTDYVVLVTEPTPFGLNDLGLALDMVRALAIPCGVVINRHDAVTDAAHRFCGEHAVKVIGVIPDDRRIAEAYSAGHLLCDGLPEYRTLCHTLALRILHLAAVGASAHSTAREAP